jgi:mediator of RNA polymerase II transcription subunit 18
VDSSPEQFADYEACFSLRAAPQPTANQQQQPQPLQLRVRKAQENNNEPTPYQLRYLGQPEIDLKRPTLVRSSNIQIFYFKFLKFKKSINFS